MKVFISWSGERSEAVAKALRKWLPSVIQSLKPWMSATDIKKGTRWREEIAVQLRDASVGITCLTPENLVEPWILFEAGAISKAVEHTFVCSYLFDLEPSQVKDPLAQFQLTQSEKEDTRSLVQTINGALGENAIPETQLEEGFEVWWPHLEQSLRDIPAVPEEKPTIERSESDMLKEILDVVRSLARQATSPFAGKTLTPDPREIARRGGRLIGGYPGTVTSFHVWGPPPEEVETKEEPREKRKSEDS